MDDLRESPGSEPSAAPPDPGDAAEGARPFLVLTRAGRHSLHRRWLKGAGPRNFDLTVLAYDPRALDVDGDGVSHRLVPGRKIAGYAEALRDLSPVLARYRAVALIDDDVETDADAIGRCFEIGTAHALRLWQPSLTWDSHVTYGATLRNPAFLLRHVNYVEMMCPFFETGFLRRAAPTFEMGLESGIDLAWCSLAENPERAFAILDAVSVRHTRPVGARRAENGFHGRGYESDIERLLERLAMRWPSCVAESGAPAGGGATLGRLAVSLRALTLLRSIPAAPRGQRRYRLKCVLDHLRHQFTRRARYFPHVRALVGPSMRPT